jgi:tetratricopeptide (TPR) repeat protein
LLLVALFTAFACAFQTLVNADYWFHLRAGESVAHGRIPRVDEFSYPSAGRPYVDLHWLFQLWLYWVHRLGGVRLAVWMQCLVLTGTFALLYRVAAREANRTAAALLTGVAAILASERAQVRPEMFTLLFLAVALWLVRRHAEGWRRAWWLFPLLFALWVNVEGLFVVGFAVLGAAILDRPRDRALWAALGLSAAATLVNPYFVQGALHPMVLYSRISGSLPVYSRSIGEFLGPFDRSVRHPAAQLFPWVLALAAVALALSRRQRPGEIVLISLFVLLSFKARRNLALLAVVMVPVLSRWLTVAGERIAALRPLRGRLGLPRRSRVVSRPVAALAALAFLAYDVSLINGRTYDALESNRSFGAGEATAAFSEDVARYLARNRIGGPIFTTLAQGSFLIWAYPRERVFIDGRLEVHSTEHFARFLALRGGGDAWRKADGEFRFEAALIDYLEAPALARERLRDPRWAWVRLDDRSALFVRRGGRNAGVIEGGELIPDRLRASFPSLPPPGTGTLLPPRASWLARHLAPQRYPWDRVNLGQFLSTAGATDLAAEQYRLAVADAPHLVSPRILLAVALTQIDRADQALEVLESARDLPMRHRDRERILVTRADALLAAGRTKESIEAYSAWLAEAGETPQTAVTRLNRARALLDLGDAAGAAADCRATLAFRPDFVEAYRVLGRAEELRGRRDAALEAYRRYVSLGGTSADAGEAIRRLEGATSPRSESR